MGYNKVTANVRIETEIAPIRHLAIECPSCKKWFHGRDILTKSISYEYELCSAGCECPVCGVVFSLIPSVQEVGHPEIYKGVLEKKTIWE